MELFLAACVEKTHVRASYANLWPFKVKGRHQKFDITADATSSSSAMIVMAALPASLFAGRRWIIFSMA